MLIDVINIVSWYSKQVVDKYFAVVNLEDDFPG